MLKKRKPEPPPDASVLDVDLHALHRECARQAQLYHEWADKLADARNETARAKGEAELAEAEAELEIRRNSDKEKLREAEVKALVVAHAGRRKAYRLYLKAKHHEDTIGAMVGALDHKKRMIEKAIDLLLADFFSVPRVSREAEDRHTDRAFRKGRESE